METTVLRTGLTPSTIVVGANGGLSQVARGGRVMLLRCGRPRLVALCVGAVVGLGLCGQRLGQATRGQDTRAAPADQRSPTFASAAPLSLTGAEVAFATDLYGQLAKTSGNIVFSPSSVSAALAMLLVGAEGDTASQLRSALHVGGFSENELIAAAAALRQQLARLADDPQSEVLTTDELWPQRGYALSPGFVAGVQRGWGAAVQTIDYSDPTKAASTIDGAVSAATRGLIPRLLSPQSLTPPIDLVVTDAVYLHASWAYPFDPNQTAAAPFYGSATQQVATMHETAPLGYAQDPGYQVVELPTPAANWR